MILFCEECGTRHDIETAFIEARGYQFPCHICNEVLVVSRSGKVIKNTHAAMHQRELSPDPKRSAKLKVLVVDDSKVIRKVLKEIIESDGRKEVVGEAENGRLALEILSKTPPDVITLDINMPVMDGLSTLKHIMIIRPTPTVMISAFAKEGALATFDSLKYGAIDFLPKPSQARGMDLNVQKEEIHRKIELAAGVQIESVRYLRRPLKKERGTNNSAPCRFVMAIGVAEGGYGALLNVLPNLRAELPAAYIAVMPNANTHIDSFAEYLNRCSHLEIQRVSDGIELRGGVCYLAAAEEYVYVDKSDSSICLRVKPTSPSRQIGPIDLLMNSVADCVQANAGGVILTGTGEDGIEGLGKIINRGGVSFVQDPVSCLYKKTPIDAVKRYAVNYLVSDKQMSVAINSYLVSHAN